MEVCSAYSSSPHPKKHFTKTGLRYGFFYNLESAITLPDNGFEKSH
jgi:hypothetical protein